MAQPVQKAKAVGKATLTKKSTSKTSKSPPDASPTDMKSTPSYKLAQRPLNEQNTAPNKKRNHNTPAERPAKKIKPDPITSPPSQTLDIYVFGTGEYGELGLGPTATTVRRPRLNKFLDAEKVGVVQIAVGGMHCVALTRDQKILTWGVNDNGALGRDTAPETNSNKDEDEDEDGEDGPNPKESTPGAIPEEFFGPDKKTFTQVAATDSASFVLTDDGFVYGWGTFCGNDGSFGFFTADAIIAAKNKISERKYQRRPALIPQLKKIKMLATGANHVQALDQKGNVFCWGTGEQSQLGRRIVERNRALALTPCQFGLPRSKISYISCGAYHSFAIDVNGQVYAWGLNNFGQTGITTGAGKNEAAVITSTKIQSLKDYKIKEIQGGNHHSIACTEDGKVLVWGRCDDAQLGISMHTLPQKHLVLDSRNKARILDTPTVIPDIRGISVAAGIDNSLAVTEKGEVYSWGFSAGYRTGIGSEDSVVKPTLLDNTAVKGENITFVGCGGQFSVVAGPSSSCRSNGD